MTKRILMVMTSHGTLGDTGRRTGAWLEEFAAPYYAFADARAAVTLASPRGGAVPIDPTSEDEEYQTDATRRFAGDAVARQALADTVPLADVNADDFDAVFYPGGHGPVWDLADHLGSRALIEAFWSAGKPVGAVCHALIALKDARGNDGRPILQGRRVTGFSNSEEVAMGLEKAVPYLVEDELVRAGGSYAKGADMASFVVTDGPLVTGQNPASSGPASRALLERLA